MSLKKLFRILLGIQVALGVVLAILAGAFFLNQEELSRSQCVHFQSFLLADELRQSSDDLTRLARTYVATGNEEFERQYWAVLDIRNGKRPRPVEYNRIYWDLITAAGQKPRPDGERISLRDLMIKEGFTAAELAKLSLAQSNSDGLVQTERVAMNAVKGLFDDGAGNFTVKKAPDRDLANRLMNDEAYHQYKAGIMGPIDEFYVMLAKRTKGDVDQYERRSTHLLEAFGAVLIAIMGMFGYSFVSLRRQITEREQVEEKLREQETHLVAVLEAAADGILAVNTKGKVIRANRRFSEIWRIPESIMESGDDKALLDFALTQLSDSDAFLKKVQSLYETDAESFDTFLFKDGRVIERYSFAKILEGRRIGRVWSFRDVTEQKALEASLTKALLQANAAAAAKSEFLSVMSHELRSPLNGVLGFAELLSDTTLDDEQESYVQTISKSGSHLLAVVNDILDFSSIERGALAIDVAPVAVAELVKSSEQAVQKTAADKGLEFRCDVAVGVPEQIIGDARRIRQILINLLANAVKFTASGSVVLRVVPATDGGRRFLEFSVEDTGIGISSETIDRLFNVFTQADATTSRRFGGTGLGLVISKRLAEAMGGTLTVTSTPDKGSTFTFRFPLESVCAGGMTAVPSQSMGADGASPSSPSTESSMPPDGPLVLIVDDDQASSVIAGKMLQRLGYRVEFAVNGTAAMEKFVPGKFSAILMDMALPVMDGLEATGKIREVEAAADGHVPIIAFTANAMPGDRERCLAAGMDDVLTKPFKKAELAAKLALVVGKQ